MRIYFTPYDIKVPFDNCIHDLDAICSSIDPPVFGLNDPEGIYANQTQVKIVLLVVMRVIQKFLRPTTDHPSKVKHD